MHILIAPDSFKGSLPASRFCRIAEEVFSRHIPHCQLTSLPMADGGEGTMRALTDGTGGSRHSCMVSGPLGTPVEAHYGLSGDKKTGIIEMAEASGLPLIPQDQRDPAQTSSRGTGELIAKVLDHGVSEIILGLGGSATNDGGAGALQALGLRLLNQNGEELAPGGANLNHLAEIDASSIDSRLTGCTLRIASDVTNPLLGPSGATMTYGPQKGAQQQETLSLLETGLKRFADITATVTGRDQRDIPGSGAAGGMGFGFLSFCTSSIESGFSLVADIYQLEERLANSDIGFILTGEGEVNFQSVQGKLVGELATRAQKHSIPVLVVAGGVTGDCSQLYEAGVISISSIVSGPMTLSTAMADVEELLRRKLIDIAHFLNHMTQK